MFKPSFAQILFPPMLDGDSTYNDMEYKEEKRLCNRWKIKQFQQHVLKYKAAQEVSALVLDGPCFRESMELIEKGVPGSQITAVQYSTDDALSQQEFQKQCRDFAYFHVGPEHEHEHDDDSKRKAQRLAKYKRLNYEVSRVQVIPGTLQYYLDHLAGPDGIFAHVHDDFVSFDYTCTPVKKFLCDPLAEIQKWISLHRPSEQCSMFVTFSTRNAPMPFDEMCNHVIQLVKKSAQENGYIVINSEIHRLKAVYVISLPLVKL